MLAVLPDWLDEDARTETRDEKTGWPTVTVRPGTWRLMRDGRLLYESRSAESPTLPTAQPGAGMPTVAMGTPIIGVDQLGWQHVLTLQNGKDDYDGQSNEQMNTGQWGNKGNNVPGEDGIFIYGNDETDRYARQLIRFKLEGRLPAGATVRRAVLVIHTSKEAAGGRHIVQGYPVLQPWTDGKTWWNNWGRGGSDPGYVDDTPVCREKVGDVGNTHFLLDASVVQGWLERPETNHGLLLKNIHGDANFHWWGDGDRQDHPPKLVIGYDLDPS